MEIELYLKVLDLLPESRRHGINIEYLGEGKVKNFGGRKRIATYTYRLSKEIKGRLFEKYIYIDKVLANWSHDKVIHIAAELKHGISEFQEMEVR